MYTCHFETCGVVRGAEPKLVIGNLGGGNSKKREDHFLLLFERLAYRNDRDLVWFLQQRGIAERHL